MRLLLFTSAVLLVFLIVRFAVDGRISRKLQYAMWLIIPLCIICNLFIKIPVKYGVPEETRIVATSVQGNQEISYSFAKQNKTSENISATSNVFLSNNAQEEVVSKTETSEPVIDSASGRVFSINPYYLAKIIWVCGSSVVGMLLLVKNALFAKRVFKNRKRYDKTPDGKVSIYKLSDIKVPFLFGNSIYIPETMNAEIEGYTEIICHEYSHYLLGDTYWQVLWYVLIIVMWFNPLAWIAFELVQRDDELAVDEVAIERLGKDYKRKYGEILLSYARMNDGLGKRFMTISSFARNNKVFLKKRIANVVKGTQMSAASIVVVSIIFSAMVGCSSVKPVKRVEGHFGYSESLLEIPEMEGRYTDVRSVLLADDEYFISVLYYDMEGNMNTKIFRTDLNGVEKSSLSLDGNQCLNCIVDNKLVYLSNENIIVFLNKETGSVEKEIDDGFYWATDVISSSKGFVVIGSNRIDQYSKDGTRLGSFQDDMITDVSNYFENEGDSYITTSTNEIQFYKITFNGSKSELIVNGEEYGIYPHASKGQYIVDDLGLYKMNLNDLNVETLAVWDEINMRPEMKSLRSVSDTILIDDEHFAKTYEYNDGSSEVLLYEYDGVLDYSECNFITIGGYGVANDLPIKWITYLYNSNNTDFRIKLVDYSTAFPWSTSEEALDAKLQLTKYFNDGNAPDIFYGAEFDYVNWGASGMVQDLYPYMSTDSDFDIDEISPSIKELLIKDSHCYQLFSSYSLYGYWGLKQYVGTTDASIYDLINDCCKKSSYWGATCATDIADGIVRNTIMKDHNCNFTEAQLYDAIEFSVNTGLSPSSASYVRPNDLASVVDGGYLLSLAIIGDVYSYSSRLDNVEICPSYVGSPSFEGSNKVAIPSGLIAMSSSTDYPEECWEIIKLLLSDDVQRSVAVNQSIPVKQNILDELISAVSDPANDTVKNTPYYSLVRNNEAVPEQMIEEYLAAIDSVDTLQLYDWGMYEIIYEEMKSYYLTGKPLDKVAESMYDRLNLYVDENY